MHTFILFFLPGNGLVLCVLIKNWNQTNLTDLSLFNLALSDLLFLLTLPFYASYAAAGNWIFGDFMCRFSFGTHCIGYFSSVFFMVFMTLDRYMVIMHAFAVARFRSLGIGVAVTVVIWLLSMGVSLPYLIFTKVTNESYGVGCYYRPDDKWNNYNQFAMNILGLVLPLVVMVACYSRIIPRLVKMKTRRRHRVIRLIIAIMLAFFLFWAPYNIYLFLVFVNKNWSLGTDYCKVEEHLQLTGAVTESIAYSHCCLNPIIYAFVGEKFMKRVQNLLKQFFPSLHFVLARHLPESSCRRSSIMSQSSDVSSTFIS